MHHCMYISVIYIHIHICMQSVNYIVLYVKSFKIHYQGVRYTFSRNSCMVHVQVCVVTYLICIQRDVGGNITTFVAKYMLECSTLDDDLRNMPHASKSPQLKLLQSINYQRPHLPYHRLN